MACVNERFGRAKPVASHEIQRENANSPLKLNLDDVLNDDVVMPDRVSDDLGHHGLTDSEGGTN